MVSDQDLVGFCKKGDNSAFETLYNRYARRMMAIAKRYCNTTFEAEDLVQDTFIKVFQKIENFDNSGSYSFEGWLKRVLVNSCVDHFHKVAIELRFENIEDVQIPDETIDANVLSKISNDDLLEVLKTIPYGCRTVFNLYAIEGYSHKEIAEICKISEGTSKSQFARAKVLLQNLVMKNFYVTK